MSNDTKKDKNLNKTEEIAKKILKKMVFYQIPLPSLVYLTHTFF